jgi:hypothetical protein
MCTALLSELLRAGESACLSTISIRLVTLKVRLDTYL